VSIACSPGRTHVVSMRDVVAVEHGDGGMFHVVAYTLDGRPHVVARFLDVECAEAMCANLRAVLRTWVA
jgi:hypothetical protein